MVGDVTHHIFFFPAALTVMASSITATSGAQMAPAMMAAARSPAMSMGVSSTGSGAGGGGSHGHDADSIVRRFILAKERARSE